MNTILKATIASMAIIGSNALVLEAVALDKGMEKCYGVVQAGKNDCATKTTSCAGSATADSQSDAFVAMPKGLCDKLVGSSLKSS